MIQNQKINLLAMIHNKYKTLENKAVVIHAILREILSTYNYRTNNNYSGLHSAIMK